MIELYNFILKIMHIVNEYYDPDLYYIKLKYKLDSVKEYNKFYYNNLNQNKLLLFNSNEAEKLFIRLVNLDENYIERKYNKDIKIIITDFIQKKNNDCYFSICDEFFYLNKSTINNDNIFLHQIKSHVKNCNCKIKVKSIVNLSINTLIKIIKNTINNKKNSIVNLKKKIKNSKNNLDLIDCIKVLNTIKANMGIESNYNYYTIDENLSETYNNLNIFVNNNKIIESKHYKSFKIENDTEYPINDIQFMDSLIQQKLNDFSYSVKSNADNFIVSKESSNISKESSNESKQTNESNKTKESSNESKQTNESNKTKESSNESKSKESKQTNESNKTKESSKTEEQNKEDLLFRLDKITEYFTNINVNNFGECISGFDLIFSLKNTYKNNNLIVKSIDIILEKVYKNYVFDKGELIKNIINLTKIINKQ